MSRLPEETLDQIERMQESLGDVNKMFQALNGVDYDELTKKMTPLDRAKYDLTILYAVNSLFWMYIRSLGEDPQKHGVKQELDRIREQMLRLKQITDNRNRKRSRLDKDAAGRMIRHELWMPNTKKIFPEADEDWEADLADSNNPAKKTEAEESSDSSNNVNDDEVQMDTDTSQSEDQVATAATATPEVKSALVDLSSDSSDSD